MFQGLSSDSGAGRNPDRVNENIHASDTVKPGPPWHQLIRRALETDHIAQTQSILSEELGATINSLELLNGGRTHVMLKVTAKAFGDAVIRLSPLENGLTRLRSELRLYRLISSLNVPCPQPLLWGCLRGEPPMHLTVGALTGPAFMLGYIEGTHPSTNEHLEMAGKALASLHNLPSPPEDIPDCRLKLPDLSILGEFLEPPKTDRVFRLFEKTQSMLSSQPLVLCHGEATSSNLLIKKTESFGEVVFLDIESMGLGNPLLDLAMLLYGNVTISDNSVEFEALERILYGYSQERKLSNSDVQALPILAAACGVKIALWRMANGQNWGLKWIDPIRAALVWLDLEL